MVANNHNGRGQTADEDLKAREGVKIKRRPEPNNKARTPKDKTEEVTQ